jgi:hypothetical protein
MRSPRGLRVYLLVTLVLAIVPPCAAAHGARGLSAAPMSPSPQASTQLPFIRKGEEEPTRLERARERYLERKEADQQKYEEKVKKIELKHGCESAPCHFKKGTAAREALIKAKEAHKEKLASLKEHYRELVARIREENEIRKG